MIDIHLDASGKTYEYILTLNGEEIMRGDGWEYPECIQIFMHDLHLATGEKTILDKSAVDSLLKDVGIVK